MCGVYVCVLGQNLFSHCVIVGATCHGKKERACAVYVCVHIAECRVSVNYHVTVGVTCHCNREWECVWCVCVWMQKRTLIYTCVCIYMSMYICAHAFLSHHVTIGVTCCC